MPTQLLSRAQIRERAMAGRGSLDLLGPSTKRAVEAVLNGTPPAEAGSAGTTNGAAMRIAPVGIAFPLRHTSATAVAFTRNELSALVDRIVMASYVTHNTGIALAGATALAIEAARIAARRGHWVAGADVASRIAWAAGLITSRPRREAADLIYRLVGTSLATQESVPAAFAVLAAVPGDPWRACLLAGDLLALRGRPGEGTR
jgi:ADP-ribosylglycohydrolase